MKNYTDAALKIFTQDLSETEQRRLLTTGELPSHLKSMQPPLENDDVGKMLEIIDQD